MSGASDANEPATCLFRKIDRRKIELNVWVRMAS